MLDEEREACEKCAYNDEGSCSCFERASIGCPYVDEEEAKRYGHDIGAKLIDVSIING